MSTKNGFGIIEIIVALGLFAVVGVTGITMVLHSFTTNRLGDEQTTASNLSSAGLEIVRNLRDQNWSNLAAGTYGLKNTAGLWSFSASPETWGKFTRSTTITDGQRDVSGNIVDSGGTADSNLKKVTTTTSWNVGGTRNNSVVLTDYFTNFTKSILKGGMLVYGNGGTTSDVIAYKILNPSTWTWSVAASTADVDSGTTTKYLRAAKLYASSTRNEKVLVSRHYNTTGTTQWIYAQVWNGTTWGNVVQLSTWTASTFLNVQNFDGTYLSNGNFMIVYSDNTVIPKMQIWNGTSWSGQTSLTTLGTSQIPTFITTKARAGTNEVMAVFFTQASDTLSEYYSGSAWSAITSHAAAAPLTTKKFADFEWSSNTPLNGLLTYSGATNDKTIRGRIWVADGSGSGTWGTSVAAAAQTNNLGGMNISVRPGNNEFAACNKDGAATPTIVCRKATFSGNVLTWTTPTNPIVGTASDTGIQISFDNGFETSGDPGLIVYSDNTAIAKYKKYTSSTSTWDAAASTVGTLTTSPVRTTRLIQDTSSNDFLIFMSDSNTADTPAGMDMYSVGWDGTNNVLYSSGGRAFTKQATSGSAITDTWYDFAWDKF